MVNCEAELPCSNGRVLLILMAMNSIQWIKRQIFPIHLHNGPIRPGTCPGLFLNYDRLKSTVGVYNRVKRMRGMSVQNLDQS